MLLAAGLFLLLTFGSAAARSGASDGLRLLGELLIPSLLPFFVAAGLLNRLGFAHSLGRRLTKTLGRLFRISGCGCTVFLLGLSGGYPLGAATVADLYQNRQITRGEACHLLRFCDNTGPAFALGAVGAAFGNTRAGFYLWIVHGLSAVILGFMLRPKVSPIPRGNAATGEPGFAGAFTGAIQGAVQSVISIAGFVVFFCAVLGVMESVSLVSRTAAALHALTGLDKQWWLCLLNGFLELSSAVGQMRGMACTGTNLAAAAFVLSWGGLCIHCQAAAVLQRAGLDAKERLGGKLLQGALSAVLAFLFHPLCF